MLRPVTTTKLFYMSHKKNRAMAIQGMNIHCPNKNKKIAWTQSLSGLEHYRPVYVWFLCQKPWKDRFFVPRVRLFLGTLKFFAVLKRIFRLPFNKHLIILESKFNACTLRISALFGTVKNICSICEYLTVTDENNQWSL